MRAGVAGTQLRGPCWLTYCAGAVVANPHSTKAQQPRKWRVISIPPGERRLSRPRQIGQVPAPAAEQRLARPKAVPSPTGLSVETEVPVETKMPRVPVFRGLPQTQAAQAAKYKAVAATLPAKKATFAAEAAPAAFKQLAAQAQQRSDKEV